ncbi:hypothetical protein LTR37_007066 [Vermiconidia calcicola]|uniref:Uncharacterized protein n=1 Tax=Vermiconidia calcicola TaxID=1690605 RepID=A0ACC3NFF3_9PEZI|nr:hypothetical protein LTR37_007066 [Vermiconidia calcicola]
MTDIQQWRRMIQPARVRTPATEIEESDAFTSPTTPRKLLKPKFSSYFTHHSTTASTSKFDLPYGGHLVGPDYPWSSTREQPPPTDIEDLIDTVMCKLFEDPTTGLTARWTPHLMRIFESFRNLKDGQQQLLSTVEHDREKLRKMELAWDCERQDYKAEVKRLELILSKGKRGLAEVTLARQDSLLRRGRPENMSRGETLETVFEFLEKTKRYEDRAWSSQRATMRRRSPSAKMRRLSRTLATKNSMMNIHPDLPFGTPPLAGLSVLQQQQHEAQRVDAGPTDAGNNRTRRNNTGRANMQYKVTPGIERGRLYAPASNVERSDLAAQTACETKTSVSDDTFSTFSCAGDLLPDEAADVTLMEPTGTDHDLAAIKRIATVLAKRRGVDTDDVMPKLIELFVAQPFDNERSCSLPNDLGVEVQRPVTATVDRALRTAAVRKHPTMKAKASEFFSKLRPQLHVDVSSVDTRRFSFEAGDDTNAALSAPPMDESYDVRASPGLDRNGARLRWIAKNIKDTNTSLPYIFTGAAKARARRLVIQSTDGN